MRTIGRLTTLAGAMVFAAMTVVGIRAIPDIKRYLKMRQM